jgi:hypothetical protein
MIRSQSAWANSSRDPVLKKTHHKKGGGVAQGEGSEFKPQHCKKKKKVTPTSKNYRNACCTQAVCGFVCITASWWYELLGIPVICLR